MSHKDIFNEGSKLLYGIFYYSYFIIDFFTIIIDLFSFCLIVISFYKWRYLALSFVVLIILIVYVISLEYLLDKISNQEISGAKGR